MNLSDLINKKIREFVLEKKSFFFPTISDSELPYLLDKLTVHKNCLNGREIRDFVFAHNDLSQIPELCFYIDCTYGLPYPELGIYSADSMRKKMDSEPDNLVLVFFWIHRTLWEMPDDLIPVELPFLLNEFLDKYPELFALNNFMENSFSMLLHKEILKKSPKLYIHVFENATHKYPQKKCFSYFHALSHLSDGNINFALDAFQALHNWMQDKFSDYQDDNIEDGYCFYHYSVLVKELLIGLEKTSDFNKIVEISEMVQRVYFDKFKIADPDRYSYTDFFVELFFRKMRALLHKEKRSLIKQEFIKIQPYLKDTETDFWKSEYIDLIKTINSL